MKEILDKNAINKVVSETLVLDGVPHLNQVQVGEIFGVSKAHVSKHTYDCDIINRGLISKWPKPGNYYRYSYGLLAIRALGVSMKRQKSSNYFFQKLADSVPYVAQVKVSLKPEASIAKVQDVQRQLCTIGPVKFEAVIADGEAWITQRQMAELFGISQPAIAQHVAAVRQSGEVETVHKSYLSTASDGKDYWQKHYSSEMVQAVGYRVKSTRGVEYRQWVTKVVRGEVPVPASAVAIQPLDQLKLIVQTLDQQNTRIAALEQKVGGLLLGEKQTDTQTARQILQDRIKNYSHRTGAEIQDIWRTLYKRFKAEYNVDVYELAKSSTASKLDIVEQQGLMMKLLSVAVQIL